MAVSNGTTQSKTFTTIDPTLNYHSNWHSLTIIAALIEVEHVSVKILSHSTFVIFKVRTLKCQKERKSGTFFYKQTGFNYSMNLTNVKDH